MPGPSWTHLAAAAFTAGFFLLLTIKAVAIALTCGVLALVSFIIWAWQLDRPDQGEAGIGGGIRLPTYMTGSMSHSWWAMVILMLVAASLYISYVFSYLYLWTVSPEVWAPGGSPPLPSLSYPLGSAVLLICGSVLVYWAEKLLPPAGRLPLLAPVLLVLAAAFLAGAVGLEVLGHSRTGLEPSANSYSAMVFMGSVLTGQAAFAAIILCAFACGRLLTKRLDRKRRVTFDNAALLYWYTAAQGLCGLVLIHGFPRLIG